MWKCSSLPLLSYPLFHNITHYKIWITIKIFLQRMSSQFPAKELISLLWFAFLFVFVGMHSLNDSHFQLSTEEWECFSLHVGFPSIASVHECRFSKATSIDRKNQGDCLAVSPMVSLRYLLISVYFSIKWDV